MYYVLFQFVALYAILSAGFRPPGFGGFGGFGFPDCANICLNKFKSGNTIGPCDASDAQCICNNQQVQSGTNCCIANTCSSDDQAKAQKVVQGICSPFGVTNAGVCPMNAVVTSQPAPALVAVSTLAPPPATTVPVPVPVIVTATVTSVVLQTSVLVASSLIVVTSVGTNSSGGTVASWTVLETSASLETFTTVMSSTDVWTTEAASASTFQSVSLVSFTRTFAPATSTPATVLSSISTSQTTHGMSSAVKAGIAITVLLILGIVATISLFFWRRRQQALDREFSELKEAHEASVKPSLRVIALYSRTAVTGAGYRDVFDRQA